MKKLSRADKIKTYLEAQIGVNRINADRISDYYKRLDAGLPAPIKDVASELADEQDIAIQRDKTLKILKTLVKPREANQVLFKLQEDGDLSNFVKYSLGFINELSIKKDLTAALFNSAWRRYKEKLIMTDNTGIAIPPTAREYAAEFLDIANELKGLPSKLTYEMGKTLPPLLGITAKPSTTPTITVGQELAYYTNLDQYPLNKEFENEVMKQLGVSKLEDVIGKTIEIPSVGGKEFKPKTLEFVAKTTDLNPTTRQKIRYLMWTRHGVFLAKDLKKEDIVAEGGTRKKILISSSILEEEEEEKKSTLSEQVINAIAESNRDFPSSEPVIAFMLNVPSGVSALDYLNSLNDVQKQDFLDVLTGTKDPEDLDAPFKKPSESSFSIVPTVPKLVSGRKEMKKIIEEAGKRKKQTIKRLRKEREAAEKARLEAEELKYISTLTRPSPSILLDLFRKSSNDEKQEAAPFFNKFGGRYTYVEIFNSSTLLNNEEAVRVYMALGGDPRMLEPKARTIISGVTPAIKTGPSLSSILSGSKTPKDLTTKDLIEMVATLSNMEKLNVNAISTKTTGFSNIIEAITAVQSLPDGKEREQGIDTVYNTIIAGQKLTEGMSEERALEEKSPSIGANPTTVLEKWSSLSGRAKDLIIGNFMSKILETETPDIEQILENAINDSRRGALDENTQKIVDTLSELSDMYQDVGPERGPPTPGDYLNGINDYYRILNDEKKQEINNMLSETFGSETTLEELISNEKLDEFADDEARIDYLKQILLMVKGTALVQTGRTEGTGVYVGRGFRYNAKINQNRLRRMDPKAVRIGEGLKSKSNIVSDHSNKIIKRFELLKAHILAGNDNPKVIKECIELYKTIMGD